MDVNTIAKLLLAITVAHGLHSVLEPVNILNKVRELQALVNNKKPTVKIYPGIDTRAKAYTLGFLVLFLPTLVVFGLLSLVQIDISTAMILCIIVILTIEVINEVAIDRYHVEIEQISKKFRK